MIGVSIGSFILLMSIPIMLLFNHFYVSTPYWGICYFMAVFGFILMLVYARKVVRQEDNK